MGGHGVDMGWTETLPVRGTRATSQGLYNEYRHASIERMAASNNFVPPVTYLRGRRLSSELPKAFDTLLNVQTTYWRWLESWTNWLTFSVWVLGAITTDLGLKRKNVFELAIGAGYTSWRDSITKGALYTSRQFEDMQLVADRLIRLFTPTSVVSAPGRGRYHYEPTEPTCNEVLTDLAITEWGTYYPPESWGVWVWYDWISVYRGKHVQGVVATRFTIPLAQPGYESMTGHSCGSILAHGGLVACRKRAEGWPNEFALSLGRELYCVTRITEMNISGLPYADLIVSGDVLSSEIVLAETQQETSARALAGGTTTHGAPGTHFLIYYSDNDNPVNATLCPGWNPSEPSQDYTAEIISWFPWGADPVGVLLNFAFDKQGS